MYLIYRVKVNRESRWLNWSHHIVDSKAIIFDMMIELAGQEYQTIVHFSVAKEDEILFRIFNFIYPKSCIGFSGLDTRLIS
ncbi:MAG: hypothetical protein QM669_03735 [Siphonobacter sp.]